MGGTSIGNMDIGLGHKRLLSYFCLSLRPGSVLPWGVLSTSLRACFWVRFLCYLGHFVVGP